MSKHRTGREIVLYVIPPISENCILDNCCVSPWEALNLSVEGRKEAPMWSKRLMRMVMVGTAVLVGGTSVAAQECQRPPAKVAVLGNLFPGGIGLSLFCDKAKAPACAVTFWCGSISTSSLLPDEDPVTWDVSVEPGSVFRYSHHWTSAPTSFFAALTNAGWSERFAHTGRKACVVRSNDPVEVFPYNISAAGMDSRVVYQRISPPEPYPCPSSNATLSGLTVSGEGTLRPSFNSDTTDYTFTTRATRVAFTPTAADSGATIRVNNTVVQSGAASGNLAVPWPRLPITVTAEDGTTTRTYYVTTTRFGP